MFETLYVYSIKNSNIRNKLTNLGMKNINYLAKGHRGVVYKAVWERSNLVKTHFAKKEELVVAIKTVNPRSKAKERVANESKWLNVINKLGVGPKLLYSTNDFLILNFVDGVPLPNFIEKEEKLNGSKKKSEMLLNVIVKVLEQCFILDKKRVNKGEMNRPTKNVVVSKGGLVTLLDFERCYATEKPHNVNQFCSFLTHQGFVDENKMLKLAKTYKESYSESDFENIIMLLKSSFSGN